MNGRDLKEGKGDAEVGSRFRMTIIAEPTDAVDRAGIFCFRGMKSLEPARQLILVVRLINHLRSGVSTMRPRAQWDGFVLFILLISGCGQKPAELVLGAWETTDGKGEPVDFNKDGTVVFVTSGQPVKGRYEFLKAGSLEIKWDRPIERDNSPPTLMTLQHVRVTATELETQDPFLQRNRVYKRRE